MNARAAFVEPGVPCVPPRFTFGAPSLTERLVGVGDGCVDGGSVRGAPDPAAS